MMLSFTLSVNGARRPNAFIFGMSDLMRESCQGQLERWPLPRTFLAGRGRKLLEDHVTQGGARSSLAPGYYQVIPTMGFQFGSVRSPGYPGYKNSKTGLAKAAKEDYALHSFFGNPSGP